MIMKISEIVKNIKETVEKTPLKLDENQGFGKLNEDLVNKALVKLCEMWNKDDNSRRFVKHLIKSFVPIVATNKILVFSEEDINNGKNRCCILGIKLAGVTTIAEAITKWTMEKATIDAKALKENRKELHPWEVRKLEKIKRSFPIEVRNHTVAYFSPDSNKLLAGETIGALNYFVSSCIVQGEKEVSYIIRQKMHPEVKENKPKKKKGFVQKGNYGIKDMVDEGTLSKLSALKKQLGKEQKGK